MEDDIFEGINQIDPFANQSKVETKAERWIVLYDIRNPKRLKKVAKIMEFYGIRVQKSVFEIIAPSEVIERLRHRIQKVISLVDYVLYINICEKDWQNQQKYGCKISGHQDQKFIII